MKKFFLKVGCLVVSACLLMSVPVVGLVTAAETETLSLETENDRPMGGIRCVATELPPQETEPASEMHLFAPDRTFHETILAGIENNLEIIDIRQYNLTENEFISQYYNFCMLHPELLLDTSWRWDVKNGRVLAMQPVFLFEESLLPEKRKILEDAISFYANAVSEKYQDPLEQLLYLHDTLAVNCVYNSDVVDKSDDELTPEDVFSFHAYGFIVNDLAVCQGYSQVFYAIATKLGYEVAYCRNNGHIWNYIKLDGEWYHMDVTWDDPTPDKPNSAIHQYFLCSDAVMQNHSPSQWQTSLAELPVCSSTKYESGYMFNLRARKSLVKKDGYYQFNFSGYTFVSDRLWTGKILTTKPSNGKIRYLYLEDPETPITIYSAWKDANGALCSLGLSTRTGEKMLSSNGSLSLYTYTLPPGPANASATALYIRDKETQKPAGPLLKSDGGSTYAPINLALVSGVGATLTRPEDSVYNVSYYQNENLIETTVPDISAIAKGDALVYKN